MENTTPPPTIPSRPSTLSSLSTESHRADLRDHRLAFPPAYVFVGVWRLVNDKEIRWAAWTKCRNGTLRGMFVGTIWVLLTFPYQKSFFRAFSSYLPRPSLGGLGTWAAKGGFDALTWGTALVISGQFAYILKFFLSKNIRLARTRVWDQTLASRGKPAEFWGPYYEEWQRPPREQAKQARKLIRFEAMLVGWVGRFILHKFILFPLNFVPILGILVSSLVRAIGTARYLHEPYFVLKHMTQEEKDVWIEERKWEYRSFGFTAALLESLPFIGLAFTVSNRIGAAMWAHDLEKRQDKFRRGLLQPEARSVVGVKEVVVNVREAVEDVRERRSKGEAIGSIVKDEMVGGWKDE